MTGSSTTPWGGLPPGYYDLVGDFLTRALTLRRDNLMLQAREFYDLLARNVDVFGTDEAEYALVEWLEGDQVRVRLWGSHGRGGRWTGSSSPVSSGAPGKPLPRTSNAA